MDYDPYRYIVFTSNRDWIAECSFKGSELLFPDPKDRWAIKALRCGESLPLSGPTGLFTIERIV
jgi:hypothetical protein